MNYVIIVSSQIPTTRYKLLTSTGETILEVGPLNIIFKALGSEKLVEWCYLHNLIEQLKIRNQFISIEVLNDSD